MKSHNKKKAFCKQLADWLYSSKWHFTTLLAATIQSVRHLPDDADQLIDELLLRFPKKPSCFELSNFLETSTYLKAWFSYSSQKPIVKSFNLDLIELPRQQANQGHPKLVSIID